MTFFIALEAAAALLCLVTPSVQGSKAQALQIEALPFTLPPTPEPGKPLRPCPLIHPYVKICGSQDYDEAGEPGEFRPFCECKESERCLENPHWTTESTRYFTCVDSASKPYWEVLPVKSRDLGDL